MILSLIAQLAFSALNYIIHLDFQSYAYSEFLISFSGGFVRRGLLGEILLWITSATGLEPQYVIIPICIIAYSFVFIFLWRKFKEKGYCWWLILSPLLCGLVFFIIRKDYLLYCVMIGMFYLVKDADPSFWKRVAASALALLGLYLHEAFIFWGIPLFALALLTHKNQFKINLLLVCLLLINFAILCYYKGDSAIAHSIVASWQQLLPDQKIFYTHDNSIGALSWTLDGTAKFHINHNTGGRALYFMGVMFWPLCFCVVYYYLNFFFMAFKPTNSTFGPSAQSRLSYMFLLVSVCLLPMFAVLSCDYGRLFQYAAISSLSAFLIFDRSVQERIMTENIKNRIQRMNTFIGRQFVPTKGVMITLLLFFGISPCYFDLQTSFDSSPVGSIVYYLFKFAEKILFH